MIDLDMPPARPRERRIVKIPLPVVLGLMVTSAAAGAYLTHRTDPVRVVAVSARITADETPRVSSADGQATLNGVLTIVNTGAIPIDIVGVRWEPVRVTVNGSSPDDVIDPAVTSFISVTATMACIPGKSLPVNGPSIIVATSTDRSPIAFDDGLWGLQMWQACQVG